MLSVCQRLVEALEVELCERAHRPRRRHRRRDRKRTIEHFEPLEIAIHRHQREAEHVIADGLLGIAADRHPSLLDRLLVTPEPPKRLRQKRVCPQVTGHVADHPAKLEFGVCVALSVEQRHRPFVGRVHRPFR